MENLLKYKENPRQNEYKHPLGALRSHNSNVNSLGIKTVFNAPITRTKSELQLNVVIKRCEMHEFKNLKKARGRVGELFMEIKIHCRYTFIIPLT